MNFAVLEGTSCEPDRSNEFIKCIQMLGHPVIFYRLKKSEPTNLRQTKACRCNSQNMGYIILSRRFILPRLI